MLVYFDLILVRKTPPWTATFEIIWESCRYGFLFYKCSRSKLLE